jgi:hypothetical protein
MRKLRSRVNFFLIYKKKKMHRSSGYHDCRKTKLTGTAIYLLRANSILTSPETAGIQNVLNFPQLSQEQVV